MTSRAEVTSRYAKAYLKASKKDKGRVLDQVVEVTGWSRDNAHRRLVAAAKRPPGSGRRPRSGRGSLGRRAGGERGPAAGRGYRRALSGPSESSAGGPHAGPGRIRELRADPGVLGVRPPLLYGEVLARLDAVPAEQALVALWAVERAYLDA